MDATIARKHLEEAQDELARSVAVLARAGQRQQRNADEPGDAVDVGTNLAESDRAASMLEAAQGRQMRVLEALRRIDEGTYGICVDCGAQVAASRLEAKPEAARCLNCQASLDHVRR